MKGAKTPSKLLFLDCILLGVLIGIVIIDLSFDLPIVVTEGKNSQFRKDAVEYYVHAKASTLLSVVIPALIVVLVACPIARVVRFGMGKREVTHLLLLGFLVSVFVGVIGPAGQAIASDPSQQADALLGNMKLIAGGHLLILAGCVFGFFLHAGRFTVQQSTDNEKKTN